MDEEKERKILTTVNTRDLTYVAGLYEAFWEDGVEIRSLTLGEVGDVPDTIVSLGDIDADYLRGRIEAVRRGEFLPIDEEI